MTTGFFSFGEGCKGIRQTISGYLSHHFGFNRPLDDPGTSVVSEVLDLKP